jgi:proline dehydrogenase
MGLKIDVDLCHDIAGDRRGGGARSSVIERRTPAALMTRWPFTAVRQEFRNVLRDPLRRSTLAGCAARKANVRLCKGIYIEPARIAYKGHDEINRRFLEQLDALLRGGAYVGIATHDHALVEGAYKLIEELKLDRSQYEFQMLLGVTERLRAEILERGHRLRVYVPYGSHWYPYSLRRLKENPEVAGHILKNMFNGRS